MIAPAKLEESAWGQNGASASPAAGIARRWPAGGGNLENPQTRRTGRRRPGGASYVKESWDGPTHLEISRSLTVGRVKIPLPGRHKTKIPRPYNGRRQWPS